MAKKTSRKRVSKRRNSRKLRRNSQNRSTIVQVGDLVRSSEFYGQARVKGLWGRGVAEVEDDDTGMLFLGRIDKMRVVG